MKITTKDQVNARTLDGRVYAAGAGAVTVIDDDDEGMVAMFRDLAARGLVDIAGDEPEAADEPTSAEEGYDAIAGQPTDDYDNRTLADLREMARDRDLPVSGNKDELITRLREVQA